MNRRWVLACAAAETLGMAASAEAARLSSREDQGPTEVGPDAVGVHHARS